MICTVCTRNINFDRSHGINTVEKHVESKTHKKMKTTASRQQLFSSSLETGQRKSNEYKIFITDLTEAMVAANIPLFKLENPIFRNFLEKYTSRSVPSR